MPVLRAILISNTVVAVAFAVDIAAAATVRTSTGVVKWQSNAAYPAGRVAPYRLLVQNNGNVQLVDSKSALVWQTNTVLP